MKPVIVRYFREFLIINALIIADIIKVTRSLKLIMLSGYKYDSFSHHRVRKGAVYGDWYCVRTV